MLDAAAHHAKHRVRQRALHLAQLGQPLRIADSKFLEQMGPFEVELSTRNGDATRRPRPTDFLRRKAIAARRSLFVNGAQILSNATDGRRVCAKLKQLRVMSVTLRAAPEHRLRKKRFAPEGYQSASVEVLRV